MRRIPSYLVAEPPLFLLQQVDQLQPVLILKPNKEMMSLIPVLSGVYDMDIYYAKYYDEGDGVREGLG